MTEIRPDLRGLAVLDREIRIAQWLTYVQARANSIEATRAAIPAAARHRECGYLFGSPGHQAECCQGKP